jgi:hypothetical protein
MGKYYLLSPTKLEVKDAQGWLDLSLEDLLSTLDLLDNGQGLYLHLPQVNGKLSVYGSSSTASSVALAACKDTPNSQHVIFEVKLTAKAEKEFQNAQKMHDNSTGPFSFAVPYDALTFKNASLKHIDNALPSLAIEKKHREKIKDNLKKWKKPFHKPKAKVSNLSNHFALLMITFFAVGFIFAYSGVTAALLGSLFKMGLLQSTGSVAMQFLTSATVSLLLWDACFLTVFAGNKLLNLAKAGIQHYKHRNDESEASLLAASASNEHINQLGSLLSESNLPVTPGQPIGHPPEITLTYSGMQSHENALPFSTYGSQEPPAPPLAAAASPSSRSWRKWGSWSTSQ